jgi:hypothetical protein
VISVSTVDDKTRGTAVAVAAIPPVERRSDEEQQQLELIRGGAGGGRSRPSLAGSLRWLA